MTRVLPDTDRKQSLAGRTDPPKQNHACRAAPQRYRPLRNGHQTIGDLGIIVISTMVPSRIFSGAIVDITGLDGISTINIE